jgi:DNA-binding response OmpR family regulator
MLPVILIVEDDAVVRHLVQRSMEKEGFATLTAADGVDGLMLARERRPTLVILDVNLPDLDGWTILRRLRRDGDHQPPVIMLTAQSEAQDREHGLELGADDYIAKPFSARELVLRVKAVLRRSAPDSSPTNHLEFPGLRIDLAGRTVYRNDAALHMTPKEFDLLVTMASRPNQVFTRATLYEAIWGDDGQGDEHTLDVHIDRVRRKLAPPDGYRFLQTVKGVGFKFAPPLAP